MQSPFPGQLPDSKWCAYWESDLEPNPHPIPGSVWDQIRVPFRISLWAPDWIIFRTRFGSPFATTLVHVWDPNREPVLDKHGTRSGSKDWSRFGPKIGSHFGSDMGSMPGPDRIRFGTNPGIRFGHCFGSVLGPTLDPFPDQLPEPQWDRVSDSARSAAAGGGGGLGRRRRWAAAAAAAGGGGRRLGSARLGSARLGSNRLCV